MIRNDGKIRTDLLFPPSRYLENAPFTGAFAFNRDNNLSRYPLSLYRRGDMGAIQWIGFVMCISYISKSGSRVLLATYPVSFLRGAETEVYNRIITAIMELASSLGINTLEFEGFSRLNGPVFYPSTDNFFGNLNNPVFVDLLKENGFVSVEKKECHELDLSPGTPEKFGSYLFPGFKMQNIDDRSERRKKYLEFCNASPEYPEVTEIPAEVHESPLDIIEREFFSAQDVEFYSAPCSSGCIRWAVDPSDPGNGRILRFLSAGRTGQDIKIQAIARIAMKAYDRGLSTLQVGGIYSDEGEVISFLNNAGARKVREIERLRAVI
ncbi:hypothetical protein Mpet_2541 [Methanolacinia petrolearia DSM 11571]|uniref:BioF2-like acetyltransferase domain-containing protein n=1 Tax=Methanolacinia petrolearia (strain DSM 11571 / OCM 486 / SEBR 4847) TaxID=679926 RepID=E1RF41_METP4|nr:hypothetical protein [Methanolacinia petrolearia]ADN37285.1 hypothetical protein Mpet_2541 [Methanolacinia petrolearia DSM 11571]